MGKVRRIWHRIWRGRDGSTEVASNMTGDSGCTTRQALDVKTTAAGASLAPGRGGKVTAKETWLDAYKKLEEEEGTKKIVEAYETILSDQLDGERATLVSIHEPILDHANGLLTDKNQAQWFSLLWVLTIASLAAELPKKRFPAW